ncbi:MAG: AMP-binding protein [Muribaculum sp.]|nr:AMP-binding protein [Muribaculaceae bacterium]MCM1080237.1 AMP-binding protein [Muribaculum sp.]
MAEYESVNEIYAQSFRDNWSLPAITDYLTDTTVSYGEFAAEIARLHLFFRLTGLKPGDKVALMGRNTPRWITVFIATITYGATIVPILQDFTPADAQHIINHSGSVLLYIDNQIWENLEFEKMPAIKGVISLVDGKMLAEHPKNDDKIAKVLKSLKRSFRKVYPVGFGPDDVFYAKTEPDDVAVLNYTSGTTGFSKGVMLTYRNLWGNIAYGISSRLHYQGSRALSFLPLAHAYGCAFDMLVPLAVGTHITVFGRLPSPQLLVKAMAKVKPNLVICVPLVLEKIYKKQILPMIVRKPMRWVLAIPGLDKAFYVMIRRKLVAAFGGEFEEVIVGGAPLNSEVEEFLHKIRFPFTVGYGMTECGPLISHTPWRQFRVGSSGRTLQGFMESKILSDDPENIPGEICVRGTNVMKGYYKNPEVTAATIDKDGWLHTGDMGTRASDGTIFIKGRYKTMILSSNGQNIYPEEIEAKLNNMPLVSESLVVERNNRLIALVYPDYEAMDNFGITNEQLPQEMNNVLAELNNLVAPYEKIDRIQLIAQEFEKTPKRSIKRYLYNV